MPIPSAPCKDCPDRKAGCHTICEKYLTYKSELDTYNKMRNEKIKIASYGIPSRRR